MTDEKFEQGFNDSELEEIMEEIESLEDDATNDMSEPEEVSAESNVESAHEEVASVVPIRNDITQSDNAKPASTSMDFSVNGEMSLNMGFHINGQQIDLTIDAEQGFVISLTRWSKV